MSEVEKVLEEARQELGESGTISPRHVEEVQKNPSAVMKMIREECERRWGPPVDPREKLPAACGNCTDNVEKKGMFGPYCICKITEKILMSPYKRAKGCPSPFAPEDE